jgi:acetyltransferase-like isoleucine patch superfamily enzyme
MTTHVSPPPARRTLKFFLDAAAVLIIGPFLLVYWLVSRLVPTRRAMFFQGASEALSLLPGLTGVYLRRNFYRLTIIRCPSNCWIGFGTILITPDITIGDHVYIGERCTLGHVAIGSDTLIGSNVDILSGKRQHYFQRLDVPIRLQGGRYQHLTIGRDVWIGNGATLLADIGDGAVIAAGAVVIEPVSQRTIVGGNPSRLLGVRGSTAPEADSLSTPARP